MSTVILADGAFPMHPVALELLHSAARVVCCDGAVVNLVAHGMEPYAIVGDLDSIPDDLRERYADILHADADQETNDLTKSVQFCMERGWTKLVILGATGGREDHTLGNVSLLVDYANQGVTVRMVTDTGIFVPILGDTRFDSIVGEQVSIFTLSERTLVTTENLKYPLHDAVLEGWWRGTLNESLGDWFGFRVTGPAIVYRSL